MPNYRLTLLQDLPNRDPAAFDIIYTYNNGAPPQRWTVHDTAVGPDKDTSVIVVFVGSNLLNQANVATRTLKAYYPTPPTEVDISISSVQPG